ncbi:MAG: hypothetical protein H6686_08980 [Fibrobacteria bacterium]|nr:hypothetical protein [Fibrobacteria bacterium]
MSKQDFRFNVDQGSILPTEFSVSVAFVSTSVSQRNARFTYSASDDVRCAWNGIHNASFVLPTGSTVILKCKRKDQRRKSYVTIVQSSSGQNLPLTLPWRPYDDRGIPVDALNQVSLEIQQLKGDLIELDSGLIQNSQLIKSVNESPAIKVYRCPKGTGGWNPGGSWGSYGCQGQISSESHCSNIEHPNIQNRECTPLGTIRLF